MGLLNLTDSTPTLLKGGVCKGRTATILLTGGKRQNRSSGNLCPNNNPDCCGSARTGNISQIGTLGPQLGSCKQIFKTEFPSPPFAASASCNGNIIKYIIRIYDIFSTWKIYITATPFKHRNNKKT
jgi:hypothetical protein